MVDEEKITVINDLADRLISQGHTDPAPIKKRRDDVNNKWVDTLWVCTLTIIRSMSYGMTLSMHFQFTRWSNINDVLDKHKDKLATALDIHAFNRDVDDLNERINEKVGNIVVV